jgi:NAD(P)-dependent dehydrogenase (short-subunit alcohol dehydrogenase family)
VKGVALHADVTDEDKSGGDRQAEAAHGIARVLMNCAGIGGSQRTVGKDGVYPLAKFVRIINVNLIGTFNVLRLFAERLATAPPVGEERGVAINTASVAAYEGQIGQIAYSASKGGVVGLTLPAARDLRPTENPRRTIAPAVPDAAADGIVEEPKTSVPRCRIRPAGAAANMATRSAYRRELMLNGETTRAFQRHPRTRRASPRRDPGSWRRYALRSILNGPTR